MPEVSWGSRGTSFRSDHSRASAKTRVLGCAAAARRATCDDYGVRRRAIRMAQSESWQERRWEARNKIGVGQPAATTAPGDSQQDQRRAVCDNVGSSFQLDRASASAKNKFCSFAAQALAGAWSCGAGSERATGVRVLARAAGMRVPLVPQARVHACLAFLRVRHLDSCAFACCFVYLVAI